MEESVINYSKKQINPLIEKYNININDSLFKQIITLFDNRTPYQIWGIKIVFNKIASIDFLVEVKNWAEENHQLIQKLSKKNVILYDTYDLVEQLRNEMRSLSKYSFVKHCIDQFNTDQRNIFMKYIGKISNGVDASKSEHLDVLYNKFKSFEKFSEERKKNFLTKCSAIRSAEDIMELIETSILNDWNWNHDELIEFVTTVTPKSSIVYDKDGIVIVSIKDFESSAKTCGGGKTKWCITTQASQFDNYIINKNQRQFFMFNFNYPEDNDLSKIGFTVNRKEGIVNAHSKDNTNLMNENGYVVKDTGTTCSIFEILKWFKVPYSAFMGIVPSSVQFEWSLDGLSNMLEKNSMKSFIKFRKGNIVIVECKNETEYNSIAGHTYVNANKANFEILESKAYIILNFGLSPTNEKSVIICTIQTDGYGSESVNTVYDAYGETINIDDYLTQFDIKKEDFLSDISLEPQILIQKFMDEGNEHDAVELINRTKDMDINYEFNGNLPIYKAITNEMTEAFKAIVNHPRFEPNKIDSFGESAQTKVLLTYVFSIDENGKSTEALNEMIDIVLDSGKFDLSVKNMTGDTLLTFAITAMPDNIENNITKRLIAKRSIDINAVNQIDDTALTMALCFEKDEIAQLICQRPDLKIQEGDMHAAKIRNINLKEWIKPNENIFDDDDKQTVSACSASCQTKQVRENEMLEKLKKLFD